MSSAAGLRSRDSLIPPERHPMSAPMTPAEIERGLIAAGVPKEKARGLARVQVMLDEGQRTNLATVALPLRLTLPWTALISDNRKYSPATGSRGGKMILRQEYRDAKSKARALARDAVGDGLPIAKPLRMIVRVYVPDARPGHDVCNFAKCLLDSLETVVFTNDSLLHRVVMERAGVDPDAPRAEIEITAF